MSNLYNIVFSTRNTNATNTNINPNLYNTMVFNVNWDAILPKKYTKFRTQLVFRSDGTATGLTQPICVSLDMGCKVNVYDGLQPSTRQLGIAYPNIVNAQYFYQATVNDNLEFICGYPQNQSVSITIRTLDGTLATVMPPYHMVLSFEGIE